MQKTYNVQMIIQSNNSDRHTYSPDACEEDFDIYASPIFNSVEVIDYPWSFFHEEKCLYSSELLLGYNEWKTKMKYDLPNFSEWKKININDINEIKKYVPSY
jgi:hypothetical protein